MATRLDLDMGFRPLQKAERYQAYKPAEVKRLAGTGLPETLRWRSGVTVRRMNPPWRALYARDGDPVLIERPYGRGSIVLATDSSFASNEALRDERASSLLAWLAGPARRVIFDETHLGARENLGLMALALKYRLHGVIAVLLLLAVLFVWKNATRLVPPGADAVTKAGGGGSGRDAWTGLVDLLQRNIEKNTILRICLAEWTRGRAATPATRELALRLQAVIDEQEALPSKLRDPATAYRKMAQILNTRRLP